MIGPICTVHDEYSLFVQQYASDRGDILQWRALGAEVGSDAEEHLSVTPHSRLFNGWLQFLQKTRYFRFHRTSTGKFYVLAVLVSEQLVRVTVARCYLCETKVCLLVHSRNRDEWLDP